MKQFQYYEVWESQDNKLWDRVIQSLAYSKRAVEMAENYKKQHPEYEYQVRLVQEIWRTDIQNYQVNND